MTKILASFSALAIAAAGGAVLAGAFDDPDSPVRTLVRPLHVELPVADASGAAAQGSARTV